MIVAFVSIALISQFGSPLVMPVGDRIPVINIEKTCKDSLAADKEAGIALPQPIDNCMRDENNAKQQLMLPGRHFQLHSVRTASGKRLFSEKAATSTC